MRRRGETLYASGEGGWVRPHPLPASSPQIAELERFALRDGSEPIKGGVAALYQTAIVPREWREASPLMGGGRRGC